MAAHVKTRPLTRGTRDVVDEGAAICEMIPAKATEASSAILDDMAADAFDALILAGGGARRLGGVDKATLAIGDRTLLETVMAACTAAGRIVVVGPRREVPSRRTAGSGRQLLWTREEPPGGGPVAGIAAGLPHVRAPLVAVLACDLPYLTNGAVDELRALASAQPKRDGAIYVDAEGRDQPLVGVYWRESLVRATSAHPVPNTGAALRTVIERLKLERVPDHAGVTRDCDTWHEVEVARRDR